MKLTKMQEEEIIREYSKVSKALRELEEKDEETLSVDEIVMMGTLSAEQDGMRKILSAIGCDVTCINGTWYVQH